MTYRNLIFEASQKYQIDPHIIAAVIQQESAGRTHAFRFERNYWKYKICVKIKTDLPGYWPKDGNCSYESERVGRAISWGLMQCLGQTAREAGYRGESLTELVLPEIGIEWGTKILRHKLDLNNDNTEKGLLAYNGGGNQNYAKEVLARIDTGEIDYLLVI